MEIERARAVSEVAQTIINSAKVELQAMELTDSNVASDFLQLGEGEGDRFLPDPDDRPPRRGLSTGKHLGAVS